MLRTQSLQLLCTVVYGGSEWPLFVTNTLPLQAAGIPQLLDCVMHALSGSATGYSHWRALDSILYAFFLICEWCFLAALRMFIVTVWNTTAMFEYCIIWEAIFINDIFNIIMQYGGTRAGTASVTIWRSQLHSIFFYSWTQPAVGWTRSKHVADCGL